MNPKSILKEHKARIVRIVSWTGAVVFGLLGGWLLFAATLGSRGKEERLAAACGAVLALVWALLVFWAERDPYHRKGVYFLLGAGAMVLMLAAAFGYDLGVLPSGKALAAGVLAGGTGLALMFCYRLSRRMGCSSR